MYGAFSGISFGLVAGVALVVIALAFFASPLIAVIIALVAAVFLLLGMSAMRQRSHRQDQTQGGAPDTHAGGPGASASGAGKPGTSRRRQPGAPASGEG
jgi:membrane protein implicated in regulation of membrane protease activity